MNKTFRNVIIAAAAIAACTVGTKAHAYGFSSCNNIGNSTFCNGSNSNGSWNYNQNQIGNSTFFNGFDSNGNFTTGSCNRIGSSTFCNSF